MPSETTGPRAELAARNNAIWCDTVCRAHGLPGEFRESMWLNRRPTPRFYPNAVTLTRAAPAQLTLVRELIAAGLPGGWAVKDSFCALDLAPLGFRPLFEAAWLWRSPALARPEPGPGARWARVRDERELAGWEAAWGGSKPRIFLPALLADDDLAFIAAYQGRRIVAGAIANRIGDVVGLSNVFGPQEGALPFWAGCVAAAIDAFPGLPLAGYEGEPALEAARALGFEALGPLRVWVSPADSAA